MIKKEALNFSKQERLFYAWKEQCNRLHTLSSFIQNNFNRLKDDEYIDKDNMLERISEFDKLYYEVTTNLISLKKEINSLMDDVVKSFE